MRSVFLKFVVLFSIFNLFVSVSFAQRSGKTDDTKETGDTAGGSVTITAPSSIRGQGVTFGQAYTISDVTGHNILGFNGDVLYDPAVLQYNGCTTAGTIMSGSLMNCNNMAPGLVRMSTIIISPLVNAPSGPPSPLFIFNFTVIGTTGQSSAMGFSSNFEVNEGDPATVLAPGLVTVGAPTSANVEISGKVLSAEGRAIRGATVSFTDQDGNVSSAVTNAFGYFSVSGLSAGASYVVSTRSRSHSFESAVIKVSESISEYNIYANQ